MTEQTKRILVLNSIPVGASIEMVSKTEDGLISDVTLLLGGSNGTQQLKITLNPEILAETEEALKVVKAAQAATAKALADKAAAELP
jgi:hypothetical protein